MSKKRFRIAFSFAGEKREFVSKVAAILAEKFGEEKILYDKYHNAEFSRSDLAFYLPDLYEKEAELVVAVFCPDYEEKEWCGLEWNAIFGLLKKREVNEVMLTRFENAEGKGLRGLAGYTDLDGMTPAQAATEILERLAINERKRKDFYAASPSNSSLVASTTIPNNLPRLESFFGRTEELKQIAEALDPKMRTWGALIDGPGGQGKTSLAVRAAYDCAPDQFDRIIFLSVKSRELDDDGERELGIFILPGFLEMLNELVRELGKPDITKAAESERIRLTLEALESQRVLLILDNLESLTKSDRGQLLTFVKRLPQGCKAILTSRRRIGSSGDAFSLEKLDDKSVLECLVEIAKHNALLAKSSESERVSLLKQTSGNPLLLRWTAGQLGRGSCRTISDALAFIGSCPQDNDPLEFIFGDLAEGFTIDETKVLVALSYFAQPAIVEHIAEVAGVDGMDADIALRTLANHSLVIPDQQEQAFALVPTVADFLRRRQPEIATEIFFRLENRAYTLIKENGYQQNAPFTILDGAWPKIAPALPLFVAGPNDRLQTVSGALRYFLEFTGRWDEWQALSEQAENVALLASDFLHAGWQASYLGWIHYLRGQSAQVIACADRAAGHWEKAQAGKLEQGWVLRLRGNGQALARDFSSAIISFREALLLFGSLSDENANLAGALNALADSERLSGDLEGAERDYGEALKMAHVVGSAELISIIPSNLAALAIDRKDWAQGERLAREALLSSEKLGRREIIASNCQLLAFSLLRQGDAAQALPYALRAVELYSALSSPRLKRAKETLHECEHLS